MALTQRLEIRQSHALVMTPQLMQAIKLLQLSNLDLAAYVEGELERNPLLERASEGEGEPSIAEREAAPSTDAAEPNAAGDLLGEALDVSRGAIEERLDTRLDNVFPDDTGTAPVRPGAELPGTY